MMFIYVIINFSFFVFIVKCPAGTFWNNEKLLCSPCPLGTYQPLTGQRECLMCPLHTSTRKLHARRIHQCKGTLIKLDYFNKLQKIFIALINLYIKNIYKELSVHNTRKTLA